MIIFCGGDFLLGEGGGGDVLFWHYEWIYFYLLLAFIATKKFHWAV